MKLLIAGIPGMGKTTIGDLLRDDYGFTHVDMESDNNISKILTSPQIFISELSRINKIVVTWGFVPDPKQIRIVKLFEDYGFKLIWFDGDRVSAFREYTRAGRPKDLFDLQIKRINESDVIRVTKPKIINTFNKKGKFRVKDLILGEIGIS